MFYEPTDINKAGKPFQSPHWSTIAYTSPNLDELKKMVQVVSPHLVMDKINLQQPLDAIRAPIIESCRPLLDQMSCILVTLGRLGLMVTCEYLFICKLDVNRMNSDRLCAGETKETNLQWRRGLVTLSQSTQFQRLTTQQLQSIQLSASLELEIGKQVSNLSLLSNEAVSDESADIYIRSRDLVCFRRLFIRLCFGKQFQFGSRIHHRCFEGLEPKRLRHAGPSGCRVLSETFASRTGSLVGFAGIKPGPNVQPIIFYVKWQLYFCGTVFLRTWGDVYTIIFSLCDRKLFMRSCNSSGVASTVLVQKH